MAATALTTLALAAPAAQAARPVLSVQDEQSITCDGFGLRAPALAAAKDLGAKVVRINLLEWRTGYCDHADSAVAAVAALGLRPQLTLAGTVSYMRAKVRAHRAAVSTYAVWNEPDLGVWRCCTAAFVEKPGIGNPTDYRRHYLAAYRMVRREDPGARVLIGELSPHGMGSRWMRSVLRPGRPLRADGVAVHPYHWHWSKRVDGRYFRAMGSFKRSVRGWARDRRLCRGPHTPHRGHSCRPVPIYNTESAQPLWDGQQGDPAAVARSWRYCVRLRFRQCNQYQVFPGFSADHSRQEWQTGLTGFDCRPTRTYFALRRAVRRRPGPSQVAWPECPQPIPGVSSLLPEGWGTPGFRAPAYGRDGS